MVLSNFLENNFAIFLEEDLFTIVNFHSEDLKINSFSSSENFKGRPIFLVEFFHN